MASKSKLKIPNSRELYKNIKNARNEWNSKTPLQKWCYFYGIGRAAYRFIRMSLMNDVNNTHWFGYFTMVYVSGFPLLSLYTMCYYTFKGELQMGLPSTCAAFISIAVREKNRNESFDFQSLIEITHFTMCNHFQHCHTHYLAIFSKRFKLQSLIDFGGKYIYHDSREKTEYNRICSLGNHMPILLMVYVQQQSRHAYHLPNPNRMQNSFVTLFYKMESVVMFSFYILD